MTDNRKEHWILFDADCVLCTRWVERLGPLLRRYGFAFHPLQRAVELPGLETLSDLKEMRLVTITHTYGGGKALIRIAELIWWAQPLAWLIRITGATPLVERGYATLAARRHCAGGFCKGRVNPVWPSYLPLIVLTSAALALRPKLAPWIFMWALALALFFGCKWITWWAARDELTASRSFGYLFLWVGMNPRPFAENAVAEADVREGVAATRNALLGLALLVCAASKPEHAFAATVGMIGTVLLLHFGLFHLLALFWQAHGVSAVPLMNRPTRATSLSEFWGKRWNRGFHDLAARYVFRSAVPRIGGAAAMMMTFLASGLVHDLVISLPAGGGYGLPTAYFLLQGAGALTERSTVGRKLGLMKGITGWSFTALVTIAPVGLLFHSPFVENVIRPMLHAIGHLGGIL